MQPKYKKPLQKSVSFWGILSTLVLIFLLTLSISGDTFSSLLVATFGLAFVPVVAAMFVLAILFIVFGIIFIVYLTRKLGSSILGKQQINKPILYTALVLGITVGLGLILTLVLNIPRYLISYL